MTNKTAISVDWYVFKEIDIRRGEFTYESVIQKLLGILVNKRKSPAKLIKSPKDSVHITVSKEVKDCINKRKPKGQRTTDFLAKLLKLNVRESKIPNRITYVGRDIHQYVLEKKLDDESFSDTLRRILKI